jgi:hypothetical protein
MEDDYATHSFQGITVTPLHRNKEEGTRKELQLRPPDPKTTGGEVVYSREQQKELSEREKRN